MRISKHNALHISLSIIVLSWIYDIAKINYPVSPIPTDLLALVLRIGKSKVIVFLVVFGLLRLERQTFSDIGFSKAGLMGQILRGLAFGLILFITIHLIIHPVINAVLPATAGQGPDMASYFSDVPHLIVWLLIGIVGGGFIEELQRVFVLTRFRNWMGTAGLVIALVISSIAFGMRHYYQGLNKAIGAGINGLLCGLIYLRKGSATEAVTAHATFDTIGIIIGYLQVQGH